MKFDKSQKVFLIFSLAVAILCIYMPKEPYLDDQANDECMSRLDLKGVDRIMIVAHPDDESLWGGAHLAQHRYLVVCLTNGKTYHYRRYREFKKALKVTNTPSIMLNYPDFQHKHRISWKPYKKQIEKDVDYFLSYKNWVEIATHNPDGEYGHQHHINTSLIVTQSAKKHHDFKKLSYFGIYHWNYQAVASLRPQKTTALKKKEEMFTPYHRERNTIKKHQRMHPYEQWIKASDWKHSKIQKERFSSDRVQHEKVKSKRHILKKRRDFF